MRLSDVLAAGVPVEWYEAVAVIRAVVDAGAGRDMNRAPEPDQIEIMSSGDVQVHREISVDDAAQRLAALLQSLLASSQVPAPLWELATQPHASVRALSDGLEYFERPNRQVILREFYIRVNGSGSTEAADELIASLRSKEPAVAPADADAKRAARKRQLIYLGAAAVAVLVFVGIVSWRGGAAATLDGASAALDKAAAAAANAVASVRERAGLGGSAPAAPPVEQTKPAEPPPPQAPKRAPSKTAKAPIPTEPLDLSLTALPDRVFQLDSLTPPVAPPLEQPSPEKPSLDDTVYAVGATNVSPPVGIRPFFPKALPEGTRAEDTARIELIVNADGTVESARLVGRPRSVHDAMLVSVAKAWRFHPAMKEGAPVRFKTSVLVLR